MYTHSKETQTKLTPELAFQLLKDGNERFMNNLRANRNLLQQVNETANGQFPFAAILSCMDSRTSAELVFDQGLGDIFSIRVAGNVLNDDILGSLEYATKAAGAKIIVVLGHSKCGAIAGACNDVKLGHLTGLLEKIQPAIEAEKDTKENRNGSNAAYVGHVTELNVHLTMAQITEQSPVIAELVNEGKVIVAGGVYDVETGEVTFFKK
ncbi:MAG: carbonic anhydrase family protein [Bacteroidota bacterium]